jgi:DNA end-binding protein Ku
MPRSLWTGSLSFGLVNVPVRLVTGARDLDLHFTQLHKKDGAPIEMQRWCSKEKTEVDWEDIAHSYELKKGRKGKKGKAVEVMLTDEDLEAAEPRKTRTIDIERFVDLAEVDPIYFDHPYFLEPAAENDGATRAYQLLVAAMGESERAALGRFVMRTKEYLALIRVRDGVLALVTMRFADEVRSPKEVNAASGKKRKPTPSQLEQAIALIESMSVPWEHESYEDRHRARLRDIVRRKRKGETVKAPEAEKQPGAAPDLMAALERTLQEIRGRRDGGGADGDGAALEKLSRSELYERAQKQDIVGRSQMSKAELVKALRGD